MRKREWWQAKSWGVTRPGEALQPFPALRAMDRVGRRVAPGKAIPRHGGLTAACLLRASNRRGGPSSVLYSPEI